MGNLFAHDRVLKCSNRGCTGSVVEHTKLPEVVAQWWQDYVIYSNMQQCAKCVLEERVQWVKLSRRISKSPRVNAYAYK